MKWFKHFSDASKSVKINEIIDKLGLDGYARWFLLLELLNNELTLDQIDKRQATFEIHFREISTKVHIKFRKKLITFMELLVELHLISFQDSGNFFLIECPILLELQNKDSKYNRKRIASRSLKPTLEGEVDTEEEVEGEEDIYIHSKKIIDLWNFQGLKETKLIPENLRKVSMGLKHRLKSKQGTDDVLRAIANYSAVAKLNPPSWYTHRFDLKSFLMNESSDRFFDLDFKIDPFLKQSHRVPSDTPRSKYAD